jgi:hypothetical protein
LFFVKGDDGEERVAGEREVLRNADAPEAMSVFLPDAVVSLVVVTILNTPLAAHELA